jgi:hypothetical protein
VRSSSQRRIASTVTGASGRTTRSRFAVGLRISRTGFAGMRPHSTGRCSTLLNTIRTRRRVEAPTPAASISAANR